jgi:hypothetical protein
VWCGVSRPKKSNGIANLKANGVSVTQDGLLKNFKIRDFVCDTVARSALKGVLDLIHQVLIAKIVIWIILKPSIVEDIDRRRVTTI